MDASHHGRVTPWTRIATYNKTVRYKKTRNSLTFSRTVNPQLIHVGRNYLCFFSAAAEITFSQNIVASRGRALPVPSQRRRQRGSKGGALTEASTEGVQGPCPPRDVNAVPTSSGAKSDSWWSCLNNVVINISGTNGEVKGVKGVKGEVIVGGQMGRSNREIKGGGQGEAKWGGQRGQGWGSRRSHRRRPKGTSQEEAKGDVTGGGQRGRHRRKSKGTSQEEAKGDVTGGSQRGRHRRKPKGEAKEEDQIGGNRRRPKRLSKGETKGERPKERPKGRGQMTPL